MVFLVKTSERRKLREIAVPAPSRRGIHMGVRISGKQSGMPICFSVGILLSYSILNDPFEELLGVKREGRNQNDKTQDIILRAVSVLL